MDVISTSTSILVNLILVSIQPANRGIATKVLKAIHTAAAKTDRGFATEEVITRRFAQSLVIMIVQVIRT